MSDIFENIDTLEVEDQGRLIAIVNSSLRVLNGHQFFSWSQCELQYLIPHEILVCGIFDGSDSQPRFYKFSCTPDFRDEQYSAICNRPEGLMTRMMARVNESERGFIIGREVTIGAYEEAWIEELERHGLSNVLANGMHGSDGRLKCFFCFARVSGTLDPKLLYLLEILMPTLNRTLYRIMAYEDMKAKQERKNANLKVLGVREIQIINLIRVGKSNREIAEELFISSLTVKNHVQNILKKLNVNTRGHAVTRAIELGLLKVN